MNNSINDNMMANNQASDKHNFIHLVADIGGTNLRIGIANKLTEVENLVVYQCAKYDSLHAIVSDYVQTQNIQAEHVHACFAIACPVDTDVLSMTNLPWTFSQKELQQTLGFAELTFINDYTAIAYSIPLLNEQQKVQIGPGEAKHQKNISVCGPGTGLGVANLIFNEHWYCVSGEGGHTDFAPTDTLEIELLKYLLTQYTHVSYEQLLSGLGIEQIYQGLNHIQGSKAQAYSAKDISTKALDNSCDICHKSLLTFCKILGAFAGNLALTMSSYSGVYVAGGIVPRFIEFLKNSEFRAAFESKGRFTQFNQNIPTYVITESQPGILGATAYLHQRTDINKKTKS